MLRSLPVARTTAMRPAPRRSTPCARWWSPHPPNYVSSCGACPRSAWSGWPPRSIRAASPAPQLPPCWRWAPSPAATRPWTPRSPRSTASSTGSRPRPRRACSRCLGSARGGERAAGRRRRQPPAAAQRGRLLDAVRVLPDPGLLGQDHPAPAEPGRRPPGQRGAVPDRAGAAALAPADQALPGAACRRGQVQTGDHPLSHWGTIPVAARGSGRGFSAGVRGWPRCRAARRPVCVLPPSTPRDPQTGFRDLPAARAEQ